MDFRGKVNCVALCNQIADYLPRTQMITDELAIPLREGRKLLVLSDRRGHLEQFEREFRARGFTSIGYYVGGMTSAARGESAKEQIILATFTLASEGMNIRDLNTVLLATPKSNIEQAVGRIFRLRPEERVFAPMIYEVNDAAIGCLAGQLRKRTKFYRACKYRILYRVTSGVYTKSGRATVAGAVTDEVTDEVTDASASDGSTAVDTEDEEEDKELAEPLFSS